MSKRNTLKTLILTACSVVAVFSLLAVSSVSAAACKQGETPEKNKCTINICKTGQSAGKDNCISPEDYQACDPALSKCVSSSGSTAPAERCNGDCVINRYVNPIINFLSIVVGLVVTIVIIVGGIQYSSAGGDPQKVAKAKSRISNGILALISFLFLWALLQWIVPGGFL